MDSPFAIGQSPPSGFKNDIGKVILTTEPNTMTSPSCTFPKDNEGILVSDSSEEDDCKELASHPGDVIVLHGDIVDVIELTRDYWKDPWEKDILEMIPGNIEDAEFIDGMRIRDDNPIRLLMSVPLAFISNIRPLWMIAKDAIQNAANEKHLSEVNARFEEYFGVDHRCANWTARSWCVSYHPCLVIPCSLNHSRTFASIKPAVVRFYIVTGLIFGCWLVITGKKYDPPSILHHPAKFGEKHPFSASFAARFRHEVIWPLFYSVERFWSKIEELYHDLIEYSIVWPKDEPHMSVASARDFLSSLNNPDDSIYIRMTFALEALIGKSTNFTEGISDGLLDPLQHWSAYDENKIYS